MQKELKVGIGDMKLSRGEGRIITYALGSCIGISFYDPAIRLGALLHIMLPARFNASDPNVFKYADSGIHETVRKMSDFGNIGQRNTVSVKKVLMEEGLRISGEDTGASYARTMYIDLATGDVGVRTFGRPERHL